ncbi:unnamed protein product [Ilex paraguariensis]
MVDISATITTSTTDKIYVMDKVSCAEIPDTSFEKWQPKWLPLLPSAPSFHSQPSSHLHLHHLPLFVHQRKGQIIQTFGQNQGEEKEKSSREGRRNSSLKKKNQNSKPFGAHFLLCLCIG